MILRRVTNFSTDESIRRQDCLDLDLIFINLCQIRQHVILINGVREDVWLTQLAGGLLLVVALHNALPVLVVKIGAQLMHALVVY